MIVPYLVILQGTEAPIARSRVPFRSGQGYYVRVSVSGKLGWFLLDSGSFISYVNSSFAEAKLFNQTVGVPEFSDDPNLVAKRVKSVAIGPCRLTNQYFVVSKARRDPKLIPWTSEPVAGVLGYNVLRMLTLGIDFKRRTCDVWPPFHSSEARKSFFVNGPPPTRWLNLEENGQDLLPEVSMECGATRLKAILDIGASISAISPADRKKLGPNLRSSGLRKFSRLTSSITLDVGYITKLHAGSVSWDKLPIALNNADPDLRTLLGTTAMEPLGKVMFDFNGNAVYAAAIPTTISLDTILRARFGVWNDSSATFSGSERLNLSQSESSWVSREFLHSVGLHDCNDSEYMSSYLKLLTSSKIQITLPSHRKISITPTGGSPIKASAAETSPTTCRFQYPGYYFCIGGNSLRLPTGVLYCSAPAGRVITVGGVPPLASSLKIGKFRRFEIPPIAGDPDVWSNLGWATARPPFSIDSHCRSRSITRASDPLSNENFLVRKPISQRSLSR